MKTPQLLLPLLLALLCGGAVQAQPGDARAAYKAGLMYRNGTGVAADAVLAAGEGVAADAVEARRWLEESAALGYPAALQELALREPDPRQAELLMRQAAHALQHRPL
jgi:TPR repeat protein